MTCPQWHYLELRPGHLVAPVDLCKLHEYGLPEISAALGLVAGLVLLALLRRRR